MSVAQHSSRVWMRSMLRVVRASGMADQFKRAVSEQLRLRPGETALDLGSGLGDDACALAAMVGPQGRVIGIDVEAPSPSPSTSDAGAVFLRGDACAMPLRDGSVDATRIERVLHLLDDPVAALREVARVLRPGGRVVIAEPDNASLRFPGAEDAVSSAIVAARESAVDAGVEASIAAWLAAAGLRLGPVQWVSSTFRQYAPFEFMFAVPATLSDLVARGTITRDAAEQWIAQRESDDAAGRFQASFAGCIMQASRP